MWDSLVYFWQLADYARERIIFKLVGMDNDLVLEPLLWSLLSMIFPSSRSQAINSHGIKLVCL